jgi:serine phosphatase RsbU (regulator of sigma subunit)
MDRHFDFFILVNNKLVQVVGSTIHPSIDLERKTTPRGFLFIGKLWDQCYLDELKKYTGSNIKLVLQSKYKTSLSSDTSVIPLYSYDNRVIAYLLVHKNNPFAQHINALNNFFGKYFIVTSILVLIITLMAFNILVLRPLRRITFALDTDMPEKLMKLAVCGDEFGKISRLIIQFFSQRNMLVAQLSELNQAKEEVDNLNSELNAQKEELEATTETIIKASEEIAQKNIEINHKKDEIVLQNKEITESITYASIIQKAVLTAPASFYSVFPEHFIYVKPRNILSGDFYWIRESEGIFYIAGADCTGHSLAGALLSMLAVSFLNDIIAQKKSYSAAYILNELREHIIESLHQTGEFGEAHGGMDIVLCIVDPKLSKMQFAGAFNPLYIVTSDTSTGKPELIEYKGDSMPVGIYMKNDPFTNHLIDLHDGDQIYIFSDGFIDQFGGPKNKKLLSKNFKNLILDASQYPICEQRNFLKSAFTEWQGENQQTDDVLLMGIRYSK